MPLTANDRKELAETLGAEALRLLEHIVDKQDEIIEAEENKDESVAFKYALLDDAICNARYFLNARCGRP